MQTRFRLPLLLAAAVILLLASCSKTNTQGKLIPKNAMLVIHLNGESLNSKLPWDEIKKNEAFAQAYSDSTLPPFIKNILDNPDNSGVDIKADLLLFVAKDSLGGYMSIQGTVKDASKFSTFNNMVLQGSSSESDGISYMSKSPAAVGWNKEKFVYVIDLPQMNMMDNMYGRNSSYTERPSRDIGLSCKNVFALKEDNSLAKDEKFTDLMKEKGDVHFWFNSSSLMAGNMAMGMLSMTKIGDLVKDNVSTGTLSFDDGKISFKGKGYLGKQLSDLFKKYNGDGINTDMVKRYPSKNLIGMYAMNFKPEGLKELVKLVGVDGLANVGLAQAGFDFTFDDFIKANKGDIFVGVSDLAVKPDTVRYGTGPNDYFAKTKPSADFIFAASVNDKAAFNSLIKAAEKMGKKEMAYDSSAAKIPFSYGMNDKYFAFGSSKEIVDKYLAGGNNDFDILKKIDDNPTAGFIDIQAIMKAFGQEAKKDSASEMIYNESLKMFQNITFSGGKWTDGGMANELEINLVDKSTNSLKQLNNYFAKMAVIHKEYKKKDELRMTAIPDTLMPPPPPPPMITAPKRK